MLSTTILLREVTVLVVDDEEGLRLYMRRVMEDAGYHVLTARDGIAALALFEHSPFPIQLVITDVFMPRMTGPELAARLADRPFAPSVVFTSGSQPPVDLPGPLLKKPFQPEDLSALVQRVLHQPREPQAVLTCE